MAKHMVVADDTRALYVLDGEWDGGEWEGKLGCGEWWRGWRATTTGTRGWQGGIA